jgi:hypothetical protein
MTNSRRPDSLGAGLATEPGREPARWRSFQTTNWRISLERQFDPRRAPVVTVVRPLARAPRRTSTSFRGAQPIRGNRHAYQTA